MQFGWMRTFRWWSALDWLSNLSPLQTEMYGVSSPCGSTLNGYAHNSLDFLDSIALDDHLQQPVDGQVATQEEASGIEEPSISLMITNVVCMANMRCHLRLKDLARSSVNVEYKALQNVSCSFVSFYFWVALFLFWHPHGPNAMKNSSTFVLFLQPCQFH